MAGVTLKAVDLALIEGDDGQVELHDARCPQVERARKGLRLVLSMFGCEGKIPTEGIWVHECVPTGSSR